MSTQQTTQEAREGGRMKSGVRVARVPLDRVHFHPLNVRRDLGDLRPLANSIRQYGVIHPIAVEHRGDMLRLRAGARRVAASKLAGLTTIPAVIYPKPLDEDEWIANAVQENIMRRELDKQERDDAIRALLDLGCTTAGVADVFGVSPRTIRTWLNPTPTTNTRSRTAAYRPVKVSTVRSFIAAFRDRPATSVDEILDALEQLATTGRLSDALSAHGGGDVAA